VAFLALTFDTRREDHDSPAAQRRAQADDEENEELAYRVHGKTGKKENA
jgi:hypothetical protein